MLFCQWTWIDIWAPGDETLHCRINGGSYEDYAKIDDNRFYDMWFNGTSAAHQ